MAGHPVYSALAVLFLMYHRSSGQNLCTSATGILVNDCPSGVGPGPNTPGTGGGPGTMPPSRIHVGPCTDITYTGDDKKIYMFTGSAPFTIKVKSHSITGSGINIGRFTCQHGAPPEQCHTYTIQSNAAASFSLYKKEGVLFGMQGQGSLTFSIDDGSCTVCDKVGYTLVGAAAKQRYVKLFTSHKTWRNAAAACTDIGANYRLAVADSQPILDDIKNLLQGNSVVEAFIGLEHVSSNSVGATLEWTDGSTFQMQHSDLSVVPVGTFVQFDNNYKGNWDHPAHSPAGADCFQVRTSANVFGWDEKSCTGTTRAYLCECFEL